MSSTKRKTATRRPATKKGLRLGRSAASVKATKAKFKTAKAAVRRHSASGKTAGSAKVRVAGAGLEPTVIQRVSAAMVTAQVQSRKIRRRVKFDLSMFFEPQGRPKIVSEQVTPVQTRAGNERLDRALDKARARGQVLLGKVLSRPEMLTTEAFGQRLGISPPTVLTRRQAHEVLGLEGAKRGFRFPEWQLDHHGRPFGALPALFERLGDEWTVYRFLIQHHPELGDLTGIEALQRGESDKVIETAETIAQSGFG